MSDILTFEDLRWIYDKIVAPMPKYYHRVSEIKRKISNMFATVNIKIEDLVGEKN